MKVKKSCHRLLLSVLIFSNTLTVSWHIKAQELSLFAEISCGEFIDKITILQIKLERITDTEKRVHILAELTALENAFNKFIDQNSTLEMLTQELKKINTILWDAEDALRLKESLQEFDNEFIDFARTIYIINDQRALIKKKINLLLGSRIIEEKSYQNY